MKQQILRGMASITASLLVMTSFLSAVADSRSNTINNLLGTSNYKTQALSEEASGDGSYFDSDFSNLGELVAAEQEVAVQLSAEGSVLLKNTNAALPLDSSSETVTLWGLNSMTPILGGLIGSSASVNYEAGQKSYGIYEALEERGVNLNTQMRDFYAGSALDDYRIFADFFGNKVPGHALVPNFAPAYEGPASYNVGEAPGNVYTADVLSSADGTAALVVLSRDNSEAADYSLGMVSGNASDSFERPLALSDNERAMIGLAKEHSSKVVVLLNSDNPMEIGELKNDDEIDAILWVGAPGVQGFLGVADVLTGVVNPSGHLSDTYANHVTSNPAMNNFGIFLYTNNSTVSSDHQGDDRGDWYIVETEGIYTGYKYYETRYEDLVLGQGNAGSQAGSTGGGAWDYAGEIAYPFGYGLSYTTFDQKLTDVEVNPGGVSKAIVSVTNTGETAGKCAVQLYVQAPYQSGGLEKAAVQLLDFAKTDVLAPGETAEVVIEFDPQYMASYDETFMKADGTAGAWVMEAGTYYFAVGNGAHEALNSILLKKDPNAQNLVSISMEEDASAEHAAMWELQNTDGETFSANVENALQNADINKLIPDTVEYMSRTDWSRGWSAVSPITPTEEMMVGLTNRNYSLSETDGTVQWGTDSGLLIADMIETDENGNFTGVVPLEDEAWDRLTEQLTLDEAINFIENNGEGLQQISSINYPQNANNDGPVGFAFDQVPGYFVKWSGTDASQATYVKESDEYASYSMAVMPTEPVVASTFNKELAAREGEILGEISLWSNIPSIMAPGLNLHRSPYCARNHEYYSEDAMLTNLTGTSVCSGMAAKGLMAEAKHFAFNHQELNRTGLSTFFTEQAGRENELRGFQGALQSNAAMSVMTSFNRIGTVYAGAHEGALTQIARREWGFTGWITTDLINGADYQNWLDAISAGSSETLSNTKTYAETRLGTMASNKSVIEKDGAFQQKMKQGIKYTLYTSARSNALNGITNNVRLVYARTWWQNAILGLRIVLGAATLLFAALMLRAGKEGRKA